MHLRQSVQSCCKTDTGLRRSNNEDSFYLPPEEPGPLGFLFAVADGLGGHAAGEVASSMACEGLLEYYTKEAQHPVSPEHCLERLERIFHKNDETIQRAGEFDRSRTGMGTTLSALLLLPEWALVAHVGDSRIYRLREDLLEQLSVDQTRTQELVSSGYLSPGEARRHPFRHVLAQAVGIGAKNVFLRKERLLPGDAFLVCSDGLHDMLSDERIRDIFLEGMPGLESICDRLIQEALRAGGIDNVTVVAIKPGTGPA